MVETEESKMLRDDTAKHKNNMVTPARVSNTSCRLYSVSIWSVFIYIQLSLTVTVFHLVWGTRSCDGNIESVIIFI